MDRLDELLARHRLRVEQHRQMPEALREQRAQAAVRSAQVLQMVDDLMEQIRRPNSGHGATG